MRRPDFERNTLRALRGGKPERAVLFELFLNADLYARLAGHKPLEEGYNGYLRMVAEAMAAAGFDYATCHVQNFTFPCRSHEQKKTRSLNDLSLISDWETFEKYQWPDPEQADYSALIKAKEYLPEGMKLMVMGPNGVLENVMAIVGYDNLCYLIHDEPALVEEVFNQVGSRLVEYYRRAAPLETVGFLCSNDDWGFNTQTFLSPADMRRYVFPWHRKIVEIAHESNKPCILHSCGRYDEVIDDVIDDMKFDCRHSYEDNIIPVEKAYEDLNGRIAVAGGMDMNFLARSTPEEIYARSRAMLERSMERGGYLLGSGNSVPTYIPMENFFAMTRAALS